MKIELARYSGFCMGVRKAIIRTVKELNTTGEEKIYVYGPLIHNPQTIDVLSRRGLETIHSLDDIDEKPVAIRTHGITAEEYRTIKQRASRIINLTCPRVAYVQSIIKKYSNRGYHTVIVGDEGHAEIKSLKSFAASGVTVISSPDGLSLLNEEKNYLLVAQTTLDRNLFNSVVERSGSLPGSVEVVDTICDSTRKRQRNVHEGAESGVDTLVVVGGKNSANTNRLADIGRENGMNTIHVESDSELVEDDFKGAKHVMVTAGASTPGWIINNVLERLYNIKLTHANLLLKTAKRILEFLMRTNTFSALFAFWFTFFQVRLNDSSDYNLPLISLFYIFSMYTVNNLLELNFLKNSNSNKYRIYSSFGRVLFFLAVMATGASIFLSFTLSLPSQIILYSSLLFGVFYFSPPVKKLLKVLPFQLLEKLYNSKIVAGVGWGIICAVLPQIETGGSLLAALFFGLHLFLVITVRQYLIDRIAYQGDFILGRDTLPIWLGPERSEVIIKTGTAFLTMVSLMIPFLTGHWDLTLIILIYIYLYFILKCITSKEYLIALKYEFLVDSSFIVMMVITLGLLLF